MCPNKPEKDMEVSKRQIGNIAFVDVSGRIVAGELMPLRETIRELLARGEDNIVLNLQKVPYIDSAGIGELVTALVGVRRHGGCLRLLSLTPKVREVLDITKLLSVFQVFENEAQALDSFVLSQPCSQHLIARAS
jgi:anti-sigma B factor antagonist